MCPEITQLGTKKYILLNIQRQFRVLGSYSITPILAILGLHAEIHVNCWGTCNYGYRTMRYGPKLTSKSTRGFGLTLDRTTTETLSEATRIISKCSSMVISGRMCLWVWPKVENSVQFWVFSHEIRHQWNDFSVATRNARKYPWIANAQFLRKVEFESNSHTILMRTHFSRLIVKLLLDLSISARDSHKYEEGRMVLEQDHLFTRKFEIDFELSVPAQNTHKLRVRGKDGLINSNL